MQAELTGVISRLDIYIIIIYMDGAMALGKLREALFDRNPGIASSPF